MGFLPFHLQLYPEYFSISWTLHWNIIVNGYFIFYYNLSNYFSAIGYRSVLHKTYKPWFFFFSWTPVTPATFQIFVFLISQSFTSLLCSYLSPSSVLSISIFPKPLLYASIRSVLSLESEALYSFVSSLSLPTFPWVTRTQKSPQTWFSCNMLNVTLVTWFS